MWHFGSIPARHGMSVRTFKRKRILRKRTELGIKFRRSIGSSKGLSTEESSPQVEKPSRQGNMAHGDDKELETKRKRCVQEWRLCNVGLQEVAGPSLSTCGRLSVRGSQDAGYLEQIELLDCRRTMMKMLDAGNDVLEDGMAGKWRCKRTDTPKPTQETP